MKIIEELSKKIKLTETEKEILEYMVEKLYCRNRNFIKIYRK